MIRDNEIQCEENKSMFTSHLKHEDGIDRRIDFLCKSDIQWQKPTL